ncbi:hypothetical protein Dda_7208 [Drechslerella dactyloides]|uniref:Ubiquitin 3 binding protein But2 C-terminal domain-containing protein n=1 Tax=Drechslerella dactyloides TaxID=74499 RepID=A0AAD6ITV0_DREDA|nr:hypothetical protein Dda_7208 [Drechslerella dactyloides]
MKYFIAVAALAATASSMPLTPPQMINAGPFSLRVEAPGTEFHELFIEINPTAPNPANNKPLAITTTSKTPSPRFQVAYNNPAEMPESPRSGQLIYTPGDSANECDFFSCPPQPLPAGYDSQFGPVEYVRDNMRVMFFSPAPAAPAALSAPPQSNDAEPEIKPPTLPLKVWTEFEVDYNGFIILNGKSSWYLCPTQYPLVHKKVYTSLWWAEGTVSDERCKEVKIRRA